MGGGRREAFLVGKKEESLPSDSCLSEPFLGFLNFSVVFDTVTQTASRPLSFLVERYRFSVISIPYTAQGRKPSPRRRVWPCCCVWPAWSVVSNGKTAQLGNYCWCIGGMLGVAVTAPAVRRRALTWQSVGVQQQPTALRAFWWLRSSPCEARGDMQWDCVWRWI